MAGSTLLRGWLPWPACSGDAWRLDCRTITGFPDMQDTAVKGTCAKNDPSPRMPFITSQPHPISQNFQGAPSRHSCCQICKRYEGAWMQGFLRGCTCPKPGSLTSPGGGMGLGLLDLRIPTPTPRPGSAHPSSSSGSRARRALSIVAPREFPPPTLAPSSSSSSSLDASPIPAGGAGFTG